MMTPQKIKHCSSVTLVLALSLILSGCGAGGEGAPAELNFNSAGGNQAPTTESTNSGVDLIVDPISTDNENIESGDDQTRPPALTLIKAQPTNQQMISGESIELLLYTDTTNATVTWYKGSTIIDQGNPLILSNVDASAEGAYGCRIETGSLSEDCTDFIISVLLPPTLLSSPSSRTLPEGSSTFLEVSASGTDISYQWYRNGIAIENANASRLDFISLASNDAGDYDCIVSNIAGQVTSATGTISISEAVAFGSVRLNWDAPTTLSDGSGISSSDIDSYKIYYGSHSESGFEFSQSVNGSNTSSTLSNLELGAYKFAVATVIDGLESAPSEVFTVSLD